MKIKDYMHFNNLSGKQLAEKANVNIQTLYAMMKGRNCRYFDVCKIIIACEGAVTIWDLLPEEIAKSFESKKNEDSDKMKLPTNEELKEFSIKARNHSKFSGMCC